MRNKIAFLMAGVLMATALTACNGQSTEATTDASTGSSADDAAATSSSDGAQTQTISALQNLENLETMALAEINPEEFVTLGEYKGVTVEIAAPNVTDEQVDEQIKSIFTNNPPMTEVTDRAVQDGDTVNIDYVGKFADSGEAFDGGTAEGADLVIGSNSYIEGFESGLIGTNVGDTVDLNLTFPENYGATDLAGKNVVFTVTVNSIKVASDEMTDEWAAGLGAEGVTTLEELKAYVKNGMVTDAQNKYDSDLEEAVLAKVTEACEFKEVPQNLYNRYLIQQNESLEYYASMYSMYMGQQLTASDIVTMMIQQEGSTDTPDDYLKAMVTEATQQFIMFAAIAKNEGIEVTEEDIDAYLKDAYDNASTTAYSTYEEFKATVDPEVYREGLLAEKVMAYLVENANVVEPAE
ncbi:MAG: trigger factor [Butyrivibrio sp.]|jgi:trigger factor|uniref:trigger factor n=1 Tax=Butyrivibrio sp. TaxID=28121 RepID=UPI001EC3B97C|nr:trigger factor [Butyrivibrio sp.]MBE5842026.1 trigger factor [Butyrivibrio sp.]